MAYRWLFNNGTVLCFNCHNWAEEYNIEFLEWLDVNYNDKYVAYKFHYRDKNRNIGIPSFEIEDILKALRTMEKGL